MRAIEFSGNDKNRGSEDAFSDVWSKEKVASSKPIIYIGAPIHRCDSYKENLRLMEEALQPEFEVINPTKNFISENWEYLIEKEGFEATSKNLIRLQFLSIFKSQGCLFYLPQPSVGVAMEILIAHSLGKFVVVIAQEKLPHLVVFSSELLLGGLEKSDQAKELFIEKLLSIEGD